MSCKHKNFEPIDFQAPRHPMAFGKAQWINFAKWCKDCGAWKMNEEKKWHLPRFSVTERKP